MVASDFCSVAAAGNRLIQQLASYFLFSSKQACICGYSHLFTGWRRIGRISMERGKLVVDKVGGKSTVTRCFSKYPFKFIIPNKVAASQMDAVWIYTITYGGGIVSGDSVAFDIDVGNGCTAVLTTQSSTKVYKSIGSKFSEQLFEASIREDALLVVAPDPVTCFSNARYSQMQTFKVSPRSSLLVVDWITSGRHERGEKWAFSYYKSTNRILFEDGDPLFLDTILLEQGSNGSISDRLQGYKAIATMVLLGPRLKLVQYQIQEHVKRLMSHQLRLPSIGTKSNIESSKPSFVASCSTFGPKGTGVIVRIASMTTESVYNFLQHQLASLETLLGASLYH